ncbi:MAG TPA: hypothetical protein VMH33_00110 [Solirubrobacterales bacterium]|nr:hypothetical protein [Solirubrobacterales bacterium]
MTERQALVLNIVIGSVITLGSFALLGVLGVAGQLQALVGVLGLAATAFMIGVIDVHYTRKAIARGEDPDPR